MNCFICSQPSTSGILIHARFRLTDGSWSEELICPLCMVGAATEEAEALPPGTALVLANKGRKALARR